MTSTITGTSGGHVPTFIEGYDADAFSRNIEIELAASASRAVVLRPATLRRGQLVTGFTSASDAQAVFADLRAGTTLTLADTSIAYLNMTFILSMGGRASIGLSASRNIWLVTFDYTET